MSFRHHLPTGMGEKPELWQDWKWEWQSIWFRRYAIEPNARETQNLDVRMNLLAAWSCKYNILQAIINHLHQNPYLCFIITLLLRYCRRVFKSEKNHKAFVTSFVWSFTLVWSILWLGRKVRQYISLSDPTGRLTVIVDQCTLWITLLYGP